MAGLVAHGVRLRHRWEYIIKMD